MKRYLFLLLLFSSCARQSDVNETKASLDSLKTLVYDLQTAQAMDNARNDRQDRRIDTVGTVAFTAWNRGKITDSLVNRKAFKRDVWGKAGSFIGGAFGIRIIR